MKHLLLCGAVLLCGAALADDDAADPIEHYLKDTPLQISDVESARFEASGRPLNLQEFNSNYSDAMAAAKSEKQQSDLFAHHHKALQCMSDRRPEGDDTSSIYQLRARCKSELADLAEQIEADGRELAARQQPRQLLPPQQPEVQQAAVPAQQPPTP